MWLFRHVLQLLLVFASWPCSLSTRLAKTSASSQLGDILKLLQSMKQTVMAEGEQQKELFEKFRCYCESNLQSLTASLDAANKQTEPARAEILELQSRSASLVAELEQHQRDQAEAVEGEKVARQIRERAREANKARSKELEEHVRLLEEAIRRVQAGAGGFLQQDIQQLQEVVQQRYERLALDDTALDQSLFLAGAPPTSAALGTLRKLRDDVEGDRQEVLKSEQESAAQFAELERSKMRERFSLQQQVQQKGNLLSDLKLRLVEVRKNLQQVEEQSDEDRQTVRDLKEQCQHKTREWQRVESSRNDELAAISETLELLGEEKAERSNSALGLLDTREEPWDLGQDGSGLGGLSLLQLSLARPGKNMEFIWMAMHGDRRGLGKVLGMIDDLLANLAKEESSETEKRQYCQGQYAGLTSKAVALNTKSDEAFAAMRNLRERQEQIQEEMQQEQDALKAMENSKQEATRLRKAEALAFQSLAAEATETKELLQRAILRLQATFKKPARPSLLDKVSHRFRRALPGSPPEAEFHESAGKAMSDKVIMLLRRLVKDLDAELAEAKKVEDKGQSDHEKFLQDAARRRSKQVSLLVSKKEAKASIEAEMHDSKKRVAAVQKEELAHQEYKVSLESECAWLLSNWDERVAARQEEVQALLDAKSTVKNAQGSKAGANLRGKF
mmetsp:Transcript_41002/g.95304  ORF Transcript_41002/g.95304 Transcript_41002/m.95304 type:complete len:676 (-) Transcript_41002:41-2068(-)